MKQNSYAHHILAGIVKQVLKKFEQWLPMKFLEPYWEAFQIHCFTVSTKNFTAPMMQTCIEPLIPIVLLSLYHLLQWWREKIILVLFYPIISQQLNRPNKTPKTILKKAKSLDRFINTINFFSHNSNTADF